MLWGQCARGIYHTLFLLIDTFIVTANILESERKNHSICANLVFVLVWKLPFQKCAKSLPGFDFHFLQFHFPRNKKIAITDMCRVTAWIWFSFSTISFGQEQENCHNRHVQSHCIFIFYYFIWSGTREVQLQKCAQSLTWIVYKVLI